MVSDPSHRTYPTSSGTEIKKGSTLELGLEPLDYINNKCLLCFLCVRSCALAENNDVEQDRYSSCSMG